MKFIKAFVLLFVSVSMLCGCGGSQTTSGNLSGNESGTSINNSSNSGESFATSSESSEETDIDKELATTWDFDAATGTLTIGGHGYMKDYAAINSTSYINGQLQPHVEWWKNIEDIKTVIITEGVTKIGGNSFKDCVNLKNVIIPESLRIIGERAFDNCSSLTNIELPFGITTVGTLAFGRCKELNDVEIPNSVKSIGEGAFWQCEKLNKLTIPNSVENIGANAFSETPWINNQPTDNGFLIVNDILLLGKDASGDVIIPDYIRQIVGEAFLFNRKIETVTIPASVQKIGVSAFEGCENLRKAVFHCDSLRFEEALFAHCIQLSEIVFPNHLTVSGDPLFNTAWLDEQRQSNELVIIGDVLYCGANARGDLIIPDNVVSIRNGAFMNNLNITSVVIPDKVNEISYDTFYACKNLTTVALSNNISSIGYRAFADCNIAEITLPDKLTDIGFNAFENCRALQCVVIPENVKKVGEYAFRNCENLSDVSILSQNISWGKNVFANTRYQLMNCGDDNSIIVWEYDSSSHTISFIGEGRMEDFYYTTNDEPDNRPPWDDLKSEISAVVFDDKITHIGSNSFSYCTLSSIGLPSNLESIGIAAFTNCNNLISISFPDSVKSIGERAFSGCSNLTDVKFPNNDSLEIGHFAFDNTLVTNVPLPLGGSCGNNGDNISWKYESSSHKLTITGNGEMEEFFYGNQIHNLSPWFDFRADIEEIEIENGLTKIGEYSFDGAACRIVKIPYSVKNIENLAFWNCDKLTDVYYGGSISDWSNIIIGDYGNDCLQNVVIHCTDGNY